MALLFYGHPFSSYCHKALISLYENGTPFTFRLLDGQDAEAAETFGALWPIRRFPLLVDGDRRIAEATIIIEHLDIHHPGPARMIPVDPAAALETRFLDRFFDNYIHAQVQKIVADSLRAGDSHDPVGVADAHAMLDTAFAWLDRHMEAREWAAGAFGLADCAAAPSLFYADWVHPIGEAFPNVRAYRQRLNARPSFARAIEDARPYRRLFPPGAPDQD